MTSTPADEPVARAQQEALDRLAAYLLPKTLEHATRNSPFYARHLGDAWRDVSGPRDLVRLPILEKPLAVAHQDEMRCGPDPVDFGSVSSGTTRVGGEVFRVERCPEEADALAELHAMLAEVAHERRASVVDEREATPALVLHILTANHGLPSSEPPPSTLRFAWSYSRNVWQMIAHALRRPIGGRRVSVMRVSVSILKQLTVAFLEDGVDFSQFAVEHIGTNAALVTSRWRRAIEETWRATLHDNYSLSEVKTPATECERCGWYHFTEPPVVAEVLEPSTLVPVENGVGHLVLTCLYPYVQRTPLIRYATGDLVEIGPPCPETGALSLRFRGRVHQALSIAGDDGRARWLLFPPVLEDIADDYAEVEHHVHPFERTEKIPRGRVGQPKHRARLDDDGRVVRVEVGVVFDPRLFAARAQALAAELRARLLDAHPALAAGVAAGRHELVVDLVGGPRDDDWNEWFVKYLA